VVRNAPVGEGGELVLLDWKNKNVVKKVPIFPDNPRMDDDPNPRGNTRGCKGITIIGDEIVAANFHTLQIFDLSLAHKKDFSHGLMVGLHETYCDRGRRIWVSSTVIDAALEYDLSTDELTSSYWPREIESFQMSFGLDPASIDKEADNRRRFLTGDHLKSHSHLHLNAVTVRNGEVYALLNRFGAICNLTTSEIVIKDTKLARGHNLLFLDDGIVVANDTFGQTVRIYDLAKQKLIKVIDLLDYAWVRRLRHRARMSNLPRKFLRKLGLWQESICRPLFVRGLDRKDSMLIVGLSPASILCIDWHSGQLLDAYQYSTDLRVCIHGLAVLP